MVLGKTAQIHAYPVTDKFDYKAAPGWKFGVNARNTLDTGSKYDFYERQDVDVGVNLKIKIISSSPVRPTPGRWKQTLEECECAHWA